MHTEISHQPLQKSGSTEGEMKTRFDQLDTSISQHFNMNQFLVLLFCDFTTM